MTGDDVGVDIVINNCNYGRFVKEAVDSALCQDHPLVRVIVVDDGSTDDSRVVLAAYDERVTLLFKDNGGQPSAVNAGFERCQGQVVMFLDADDRLAPQAAGLAAAAFMAHPGAARLQFRVAPMDETGRTLHRAPGTAAAPQLGGDLRRSELAAPFEMPNVPTSANAFRTERLREIMPIPEHRYGNWGADYYLVHLSTLLGEVILLNEVGAYYRVHGGNAFQPSVPVLDLERIRSEIRYQMVTLDCLGALADRLTLDHKRPIVSVSNLVLRLISRRLAPGQHPVPGDRSVALLLAALRASRHRSDLSLVRRSGQLAVLSALVLGPRPLARRLAALIVFPELRDRRSQAGRKRDDTTSNPPAHPAAV